MHPLFIQELYTISWFCSSARARVARYWKMWAWTMGVRRNFSSGGQRRNFAYHFQATDDAM